MPEHITKMIENNMPVTDEQGSVRLGLFLVKTLVQRLGGTLKFRLSKEGVSQAIMSIPAAPSSGTGDA